MSKEYKITHEELVKLGEMLGEVPAKYAIPCLDLLRAIANKPEDKKDAEPQSN